MQFNNFFRRMLPIAAAVAISSASFTSFAQSYDVHNVTTGLPINTFATLQAAVDACPTSDSCVITLTGANDTLNNVVNILSGQNITLTSDIGRTIVQKGYHRHIISWGGELTIENIVLKGMGYSLCELTDLYQEENGGIHSSGKLTIKDGSVIMFCTNLGTGGGCWADTVYMYGGEISHNICRVNGGGIAVSDMYMYEGAVIKNNTASNAGGGVHSPNFTIYGGEISGNTAALMGGGVCTDVDAPSVFTMKGGVIENNTAHLFGGGIAYSGQYDYKHTVNINGGEIRNNTAFAGAGIGMFLYGDIYMSDGEIHDNHTIQTATPETLWNLMAGENRDKLCKKLDEILEDMGYENLNELMTAMGASNLDELIAAMMGGLVSCGGGIYAGIAEVDMTGGKIYNNHATNGGGGIFTADYNYDDPMQAYKNISITNKDWIYDNTAGQGSLAPFKPAGWDTEHHFDISLLTNHQINYRPTPPTLDTICFTSDSITLAVTVKNGGQNPTYQWFRNGKEVVGEVDSIFKYKSSGRDTIQCKVYPDTACGNEVYSKIMVIEMLDSLALDQPENIDICAGKTIENIVFTGTYDYVRWEVTTGNGLTIGMPANSGTGDISSFTATNSGEITITATPVSGECEGDPKTFTITVTPKVKTKATIRIK